MNFWDELIRLYDSGRASALCILVAVRGSTPQVKGAKMLVHAEGASGTIGGGCAEAEIKVRAADMLRTRSSGVFTFKLDHNLGYDDGMICGGEIDVLIQFVDPDSGNSMRSVLEDLRKRRSSLLKLEYVQDGVKKRYEEDIGPPPRLIIAGAGHVGQAVAAMSAELGFEITVIDDRADMITTERFPTAHARITGDIANALREAAIDENCFVIVVTRGHKHDGVALRVVIESNACYIGMIGSKKKIRAIYENLALDGVSIEAIARVHAPIGFDLGAITVHEIAISIVAELVAIRRGREGVPATPLRLSRDEIASWISKGAERSSDGR